MAAGVGQEGQQYARCLELHKLKGLSTILNCWCAMLRGGQLVPLSFCTTLQRSRAGIFAVRGAVWLLMIIGICVGLVCGLILALHALFTA